MLWLGIVSQSDAKGGAGLAVDQIRISKPFIILFNKVEPALNLALSSTLVRSESSQSHCIEPYGVLLISPFRCLD